MSKIRKAVIIWTITTSAIISIGAGHGVAPMGLIQFWTFFTNSSEIWTIPTALFSTGQLIILISIVLINSKVRGIIYFLGTTIISIGIAVLISIGLENNNSAIPTFITMIPFCVVIVRQIFKTVGNIL